MGRKNGCREGVEEPQDQDGSGDREEWLDGDFGGHSLLNGSNSLFFGIVPSVLGECPLPHIKDFAGVRICVYFGKN